MVYLKRIVFPGEAAEYDFVVHEKRSYIHTAYPFKLFPQKGLKKLSFDDITMFYGGNGSGKSTLINVLARKMNADRYSAFNDAPLFDDYVRMCDAECFRVPEHCCVLSSDDVFDYMLNARSVNESIDDRRKELLDDYVAVHRQARQDREIMRLNGMADYDRWNTTMEILSRKHSQSSYMNKRLARGADLHSNGESAMHYFLERIEEDGLYFLDEPENSLSVELQIQLAEFVAATARVTRSQFVIATHSPIFLSMKNAKIYNLDEYPVSVCKWTELPNVRKSYDFFMEHREEFQS